MLMSVAAARQILQKQFTDRGDETVALEAAAGRVLRQEVVADRDQPPFDRVAMDGIALLHAAYAAGRRRFPVALLQAAGDPPVPLPDPTHCVEIMTGAALPPGTDTVVRYEDLSRDGDAFLLPEGIEAGTNIHRRGKDTAAGTVLARPGQLIGVAVLGMLATCGYPTVRVATLPRVAIVATGNELVAVSARPAPHQIRRSNLYQLHALLRPLGIAAGLFHLPDDRLELAGRLTDLLAAHDVVILSGGVSKGKLDFVPEVLAEVGVEKLLHGVAQRPGKPLWAGRRGDKLVFGLPGNPVSSVSCAIQYVLPYLRGCLGLPEPSPTYARLAEDVDFSPALTLFQRVGLHADERTGALVATPVRHAGSGDAGSLLRTQGFAELPADRSAFAAGEVVRITLL